eukprot:5914987-Amphidinium_carterae.1
MEAQTNIAALRSRHRYLPRIGGNCTIPSNGVVRASEHNVLCLHALLTTVERFLTPKAPEK